MSTTMTEKEEETQVTGLLARAFYLKYCKVRGTTPNPQPYVPAWAIDYAVIGIRTLGYDDDAIEELRREVA